MLYYRSSLSHLSLLSQTHSLHIGRNVERKKRYLGPVINLTMGFPTVDLNIRKSTARTLSQHVCQLNEVRPTVDLNNCGCDSAMLRASAYDLESLFEKLATGGSITVPVTSCSFEKWLGSTQVWRESAKRKTSAPFRNCDKRFDNTVCKLARDGFHWKYNVP